MTTEKKTARPLNSILWIIQSFLALSLIGGGIFKLVQPIDELAKLWPWTAETGSLVYITAIVDILIGVGIFLPALLKIRPKLSVYAAFGLILLMIAASIFHISRGEISDIGFNIVLCILAIFLAWGRITKAPIQSN